MNYRIALLEDNQKEAAMLKKHLLQFQSENQNIYFKLDFFENGEVFIMNYHPVYDLIFMDIGLPKINGMDVAAWLRKTDQTVILIFVTSMANYAVNGYEVNAFDFILKPVSYPAFSLKMKRALNKLDVNKKMNVIIKIREGFLCLSASQIRYVEVRNHSILYHTSEGIFESYGNLKLVEKNLNSKLFCRCNSSYLVNLSYVLEIYRNEVLVGSDKLPLSRSKRKDFTQTLNNFIGGNFS